MVRHLKKTAGILATALVLAVTPLSAYAEVVAGPGLTSESLSSTSSSGGGWVQDENGWQYVQNGTAVTYSWIKEGGHTYYIASDGYMKTGWREVRGQWYYFDPDVNAPEGAMRTGWLDLGGSWFYLGSDGVMLTGYQTIGDNNYYFAENGMMLTNGTAPDGRTAGGDGILH